MRHLSTAITCVFVIGCGAARAQEPDHTQVARESEAIQSNSQPDSDDATMSVQEQFDLLYQSLRETYNDFEEDVAKTLAFLIIVLGWFIALEKSREFFRNNSVIRYSSMFAVALICAIHIRACVLKYLSSQSAAGLLDKLGYIGAAHYSDYRITTLQLVSESVQNVALFGVLMVILITLKRKSDG